MGKSNNQKAKRSNKYKPFYPTTLGPILHDVTFQKLPCYSLRPKPDPINKMFSPGPAAYPGDHALIGRQKHRRVSRTIYPADKAHIYSMRIKGKDLPAIRTPGPAAYPFEDSPEKDPLQILPSIYPKDKGNIFSMRKKKLIAEKLDENSKTNVSLFHYRDEKYFTVSPGPAVYPRDAEREDVINSIHPRDLANKFSIVARRDEKLKLQSPGPALYPHNKDPGDKNKTATIYPTETQLPPTFKGVYNIRDRQKRPAPNSYPKIEEKHDPKRFKIDFMKKMSMSKKAPAYSMGVRHTPKQQYLILPEDEY